MVGAQGLFRYGLAAVFWAIPAEVFPGKQYGTIFGTLNVASNAGAACEPWITGLLYDATGTYAPAFVLAMAMSLVSILAMWTAAPPTAPPVLPTGHSPHDEQRLGPHRDGSGQWNIWRCMRQILLTDEEPYERSTPLRDMAADDPTQHRIAGFEGVEDQALCRRALDVQLHLALDACERPQMCR